MKTPEEIKKAMTCCFEAENCEGCPYDYCHADAVTDKKLICDMTAYIEQLEAQLGKRNNLIDVLEDKSDENT